MKKLVLIGTIFIFLINSFLFGENKLQDIQQNDTKQNFNKIQKRLNDEYNSQNPSVRRGWKQFKRWEYFWGQRTFPTGEFPDPYKIYQESITFDKKYNNNNKIQANNQWKQLGPFAPPSSANTREQGVGRVNIVRFNPKDELDLWIGAASGGVWRSTNGGNTWINYPFTNFLSLGVSDIAIAPTNPNVVYVTTGDADGSIGTAGGYYSIGIIKTTDNGATWFVTNFSKQLSEKKTLTRILVDPNDENTVIVGANDGIYKTTDGGNSWIKKFADNSIIDMEFKPDDPNVVYASSYGFSGKNFVFKSTDKGESWKSVFSVSSSNRLCIEVSPADANSIYCLASNSSNSGFNSLAVSQDGGETWNVTATTNTVNNILGWYDGKGSDSKGQGMYDLALAVSPKDPYNLFIGGVNIWKTNDLGFSMTLSTHWYGYYSLPYVHADIHDLRFSPSGKRLYACSDGGISFTANGGADWVDISKGLSITQFYRMGSSDLYSDVIVAGAQDNGTSALINNEWKHVYSADGMEAAVDPTNPNRMYVSIYYGSFYRSNNGGVNFTRIIDQTVTGESGAWVTPFAIDPKNPQNVYAGFQNVWKNTKYGELGQWTKISNFGSNLTLNSVVVAPSDSNVIYAANATDVFVTIDGGKNWNNVYHSNTTAITYIAVDPYNPKRFWVTKSGFSNGDKVYEIENDNVINLSGNLPNIPVNTIVYQKNSPDRIYIGTDIGVYYSDYGSGYWEKFGTELPNLIIQELEINYGQVVKLRAATYGRGIWETEVLDCNLPEPEILVNGKTVLCEGDSVELKLVGNYSNFEWSTGEKTSTIKVNKQGIYSVIVTSDNGCKAKSKGVEIKVYSIKDINITSSTGKFAFCGDEKEIELRANLGFQSYRWSTGDTVRKITITEPGEYKVYGITAQGCTSPEKVITIVRSEIPPQPIILREGNTLIASVEDTSYNIEANHFQWYLDGKKINNATSQTYNLQESDLGNFTVEMFNEAECSSISPEFQVDGLSVKSSNNDNSFILLSPNPNYGEFKIITQNIGEGDALIEIKSIDGKIVFSKKVNLQDNQSINININNVVAGAYLLQLEIKNTKYIKKFIKQ